MPNYCLRLYGTEMTTEASTAEPLPRQRTSHSAFPIPSLHRPTTISDHTFDVVQLAQQIYSGGLAKETHTPLPRSRRWAQWIFWLEEVWKEDADMNDRPLVIHCSGLGGGLLSPDHDYDLFFQNHAQMKVWPSLAMIDNWELRVSQLELTKTTHEYVIYQLFFRPTPSWLSPGRSTCFIACCKMGLID